MTITAPPTTTPVPTPAGPIGDRPSTRSNDDYVKAIPAVLRSEWIKLSSLRSNKAILVLTLAIAGFTSWAVATLVTDEVLTVSEVFVHPTWLVAVLAAIASILLFTSEVHHGTLATTLTAQPTRWVIAVTKTMMAIAVGLALGAVGMIAGVVGSVAGGLEVGDTSAMAATTLWALLFTSLAAVLGLGVGMIVGHSAGAISGLLVWSFGVENLVLAFAPPKVVHFLPFDAGFRLLGIVGIEERAELIEAALTRPQYALIFGGYAMIALVVGTVLLYRRDAS